MTLRHHFQVKMKSQCHKLLKPTSMKCAIADDPTGQQTANRSAFCSRQVHFPVQDENTQNTNLKPQKSYLHICALNFFLLIFCTAQFRPSRKLQSYAYCLPVAQNLNYQIQQEWYKLIHM